MAAMTRKNTIALANGWNGYLPTFGRGRHQVTESLRDFRNDPITA